jgi:putative restriction endonuclease
MDLYVSARRKRDPEFRNKVMMAYEFRCAVCGFDVRLDASQVGIEAAHIKWHQAGGPDIVTNGLALCVLHHKLFDRGVFTVLPDLRLSVSEHAYGTKGFEEWVMAFHGKEIRYPQNAAYYPSSTFLKWHYSEVFRSPSRHFGLDEAIDSN